jgi:glycerol-3-phosphate dehydrogenase (NAD(P)+)
MTKSKFNPVGVIGAGAVGNAIGGRLKATGVEVNYWDNDRTLSTVATFEELVSVSRLVILCTPSNVTRVLARDIARVKFSGPHPAVLSMAKGVESGFVTMAEVLAAELGDDFAHGVVSGPMLADEIAAGEPVEAVIGMSEPAVSEIVSELFAPTGITLEVAALARDVALCGALKNIYALGLGIHDGLGYGNNSKSALTVDILREFRSVLEHLHADGGLADSQAGLGDLLTTGWSGASFNYGIGRSWAEGDKRSVGEGFRTLREVAGVVPLEKFPIVRALFEIFYDQVEPLNALKKAYGSQVRWT